MMVLGSELFALERSLYLNLFADTINQERVNRPIFNATPVATDRPVHLHISVGDSLILRIFNNLQIAVDFAIDGQNQVSIPANSSRVLRMKFDDEGHHYYGLGGALSALSSGAMLIVGQKRAIAYYLKLSECDPNLNEQLLSSGPKEAYYPTKFMVNDRQFDHKMHDHMSSVNASVGDSVQLFMYNASDFMHHAPHFHGFHVLIVRSAKIPFYEGMSKDSFGMPPKSVYELLLVPDKPGEYPIHNHNLITVTTDANYPGGMMAHMMISP